MSEVKTDTRCTCGEWLVYHSGKNELYCPQCFSWSKPLASGKEVKNYVLVKTI